MPSGAHRHTVDVTFSEGLTERVVLHGTPTPFGAVRWWLVCVGCGTRRAALYSPAPGRSALRCRRCYRLAYPSQRRTAEERALCRARQASARLGFVHEVPADSWDLVESTWEPDRPHGMRRRTYARRVKEWHAAIAEHASLLDAHAWRILAACDRRTLAPRRR